MKGFIKISVSLRTGKFVRLNILHIVWYESFNGDSSGATTKIYTLNDSFVTDVSVVEIDEMIEEALKGVTNE